MHKPTKAEVLTFATGALAALVGAKFAKSKTARKLAVHGVAGGLKLRDDTARTLESIREEAQDIYEEARRADADKAE
jgi:hypothetical protein